MNNCQNGRVDILGPIGPQFNLADKIPLKHCASYRDALTGSWTDTLLSTLFFSKENIQILQNAIKRGVYDRSNKQFIIGGQNCDELKTIMRSIYLVNSANLPYDIKYQISALNDRVVDYAIKQVYSEAISYIKYKYDVSTLRVPISLATNTSSKGNTLELSPFV
jgi:hypothetical protein